MFSLFVKRGSRNLESTPIDFNCGVFLFGSMRNFVGVRSGVVGPIAISTEIDTAPYFKTTPIFLTLRKEFCHFDRSRRRSGEIHFVTTCRGLRDHRSTLGQRPREEMRNVSLTTDSIRIVVVISKQFLRITPQSSPKSLLFFSVVSRFLRMRCLATQNAPDMLPNGRSRPPPASLGARPQLAA